MLEYSRAPRRSLPSRHRYTLRALRKTPTFAATALAALALGIGANTAIFSVVNTVLLRPLAYPDADRIVLFFQTTPAGPNYGASATKFNVLRRQTTAFQDVSTYEYRGAGLNLTGAAYPEQIHGIRVSADYFRLFGAPLALVRQYRIVFTQLSTCINCGAELQSCGQSCIKMHVVLFELGYG